MPKFMKPEEYEQPVDATPASASPDALALIAQAIQQLAKNGETDRLATIEKILLHQEQARPHENLFNPPMISALNPLGERDHPRPDLKCKMIWVGHELTKEGLSREEIELLNRMQPGEYRVTKADGLTIPFRVSSRVKDSGALDHLSFHFPCKTPEHRQNHAPMTSYLREVLGEAQTVQTLQAEVERLRALVAGGAV